MTTIPQHISVVSSMQESSGVMKDAAKWFIGSRVKSKEKIEAFIVFQPAFTGARRA